MPASLTAHPTAIAAEPSTDRLRRWAINGDFTALQPNGVARYARQVTLALDELITEQHPLTCGLRMEIIIPRSPDGALPLKSISVRSVPEFRRPRLPQLWVQVQLPWRLTGGLLSFCNLAPIAVKRQIVCIHDLHTRLMPDSYGRLFRWTHRVVLPVLGRRVARITTVSQLSRKHLTDYGIALPDKISVTYNGADHVAEWDSGRSTFTAPSERPYALCLGRSQKYKNVELMVRLAPVLDRMGIDLLMAGDINPQSLNQWIDEKPPNLHLMGRVSDDDFKRALGGAICFLFPSRIEGFGLPAVEAMMSGCPLVCSTAPCLPEICGEAALYADPDDLEGWATAIGSLRDDQSKREKLIAEGVSRCRTYSWRRIAEGYLTLMAEIDGLDMRNEPPCQEGLAAASDTPIAIGSASTASGQPSGILL